MTYKDLDAWTQAMNLAEACYRETGKFPAAELYGLTSQVKRAAVSIPSNLAEGYCRRSTRAYLNHVSIALGSHAEVETCIELARRFGFLSKSQMTTLDPQITLVGKLLSGLHKALKEKVSRRRPSPKSPAPSL